MQSISFYHKINKNKNTSALQLVEAISTIEASKDLINKKTYNIGHRRLKKHQWIWNNKHKKKTGERH